MKLAKLLVINRRWSLHHQVACLLVHREKCDVAQIVDFSEQHDDAINAWCDAAMRWSTITERVQHATKLCLDHVGAIASKLKRFQHDVRAVVPDRAGRQFNTVTDDIVLERFQLKLLLDRIGLLQRFHTALRHGERVVREVDLLVVLVPLIHREIDDPAELEDTLLNKLQLFANLVAGSAGQLVSGVMVASGEEDTVACAQPESLKEGFQVIGVEVLQHRVLAVDTAAIGFFQAGIAKARCLHFLFRPLVEIVEELAGLLLGRLWCRNGDNLAATCNDLREDGKARLAVISKEVSDVGKLDRIAQVRLVRAVLRHGFGVWNARERAFRHGATLALPVSELLKDAAHHRLDRLEDVFLLNEAHLDIELVELTR